jgi:hypothetical protein
VFKKLFKLAETKSRSEAKILFNLTFSKSLYSFPIPTSFCMKTVNFSHAMHVAVTNSLLASGRGYKSGETTIANVGRICTVRSVGISVDINPFEPHILASNMAHAIGHNLGFAHDDRSGGSPSGQYVKRSV